MVLMKYTMVNGRRYRNSRGGLIEKGMTRKQKEMLIARGDLVPAGTKVLPKTYTKPAMKEAGSGPKTYSKKSSSRPKTYKRRVKLEPEDIQLEPAPLPKTFSKPPRVKKERPIPPMKPAFLAPSVSLKPIPPPKPKRVVQASSAFGKEYRKALSEQKKKPLPPVPMGGASAEDIRMYKALEQRMRKAVQTKKPLPPLPPPIEVDPEAFQSWANAQMAKGKRGRKKRNMPPLSAIVG